MTTNKASPVPALTAKIMKLITPSKTTIQELRDNLPLWFKIHVSVYDLRNFQEVPKAQMRLDQITDASYLGFPYFTATEISQLKSTVVDNESQQTLEQQIEGTLNERLERRMKKRVESKDYQVCAAHDLAPIFEKVFDIKPKQVAKDREFLAVMEKSGLVLEDGNDWKGTSKKRFQKKIKKHGRNQEIRQS